MPPWPPSSPRTQGPLVSTFLTYGDKCLQKTWGISSQQACRLILCPRPGPPQREPGYPRGPGLCPSFPFSPTQPHGWRHKSLQIPSRPLSSAGYPRCDGSRFVPSLEDTQMHQWGNALPYRGLSMELGLLLMALSDQALPRCTVPLGGGMLPSVPGLSRCSLPRLTFQITL